MMHIVNLFMSSFGLIVIVFVCVGGGREAVGGGLLKLSSFRWGGRSRIFSCDLREAPVCLDRSMTEMRIPLPYRLKMISPLTQISFICGQDMFGSAPSYDVGIKMPGRKYCQK